MRSAAALPRWPLREGAEARRGRPRRAHPSPSCEAALVDGLTEGGSTSCGSAWARRRCSISPRPTLDVDGGIQITGSHNPADYNGFKMVLERPLGLRRGDPEARPHGRRGRLERGRGQGRRRRRPRRLCRPRWSRASTAAPIRIGWDAGNGAAGPVAREAGRSACRASITRSTPRSTAASPTTIPIRRSKQSRRPEALVADKSLDFGIAFDGDGDRIGAVDGEGRVIWGDQLLIDPRRAGAAGAARARRSSPTSRPARPCSTASPSSAASR